MTSPALILPAAGTASRMRGADKLLEEVEGLPVLRLLAERGLAAGLEVYLTVPSLDHPRARALRDVGAHVIAVPEAQREGMAASLRAAIGRLDAGAALILPADMPEITREDLQAIATAKGDIIRATAADGTPGHPVRFARRFFPEFLALRGDQGARNILTRHSDLVTRRPLPDRHAITDLDTPEEWAAWRAGQAAQ